jgi:histidinol-phosphate aminotransferase
MAVTRRGFVRTLGIGGAGLWSGALVSARGHEAWTATGLQAAAPAPGGLLRLDSNENPMGPGPMALEAIRAAIGESKRYPHRAGNSLAVEVARMHGVKENQVLTGAGSGEILRIAVQAACSPTRPLVTALPTFETCTRTAQAMGFPLHEVPVDAQLRLDLAGMEQKAPGAGLVFLCNPNNPTGTVYGASVVADFVRRIVKASPSTLVLVDEAYHEYVDDPAYATAVPLAMEYPQVIVSRTLSKVYGMAGLRVGYAIGQAATLEKLQPWKLGNGMNIVGLLAAPAALRDTAHVERDRKANRDARDYTRKAFEAMGFHTPPTHANFVFADIGRDAAAFARACRDQGVAVGRPFPLLTSWTRVSIGTMAEMEQAVGVFRKVLGVTATASRG